MRHFNVNFFKFILFTYNVNAYVNDDANLWKKSESTTTDTHIATYEKFTIENQKNLLIPDLQTHLIVQPRHYSLVTR